MPLRLYNTLTRQVETFREDKSRPVLFYSCGPTVYDFAHIGNFRSFLNADLLRRTLELLGYQVRHVMNMTDVGHMTEDDIADGAGEDKMAEAARRIREAKKAGTLPPDAKDVDSNDPSAIAEFYISAFQRDAKLLGIKVVAEAAPPHGDPSLLPRPTQYVQQMIALVEALIRKKHAYLAQDGAVYFDVPSFPQYGQLSGNTLDRLRAGEGGRVSAENQAVKKHPADFLLWKGDPTHLMRWPSPWGEGYPGWHLECSAMAKALLGEEIDIHSGGEDNIFPHHECEIAQTCSATGRPVFARHWFHTRHLMVEGEKMSKSKGNFYTVSDLAQHGDASVLRVALISTHYRKNANFTIQGLIDERKRVYSWRDVQTRLRDLAQQRRALPFRPFFESALERFKMALCDDLNISVAIAELTVAAKEFRAWDDQERLSRAATIDDAPRWNAQLASFEQMFFTLTGDDPFGKQFALQKFASIEEAIEHAFAQRNAARQRKDYAEADRLRNSLRAKGYEIEDTPEGPKLKRIVQ